MGEAKDLGTISWKMNSKTKIGLNPTSSAGILDSNNFSIGIHFFKVLVQIHYPGEKHVFTRFEPIR